jgi:organic hydroperoxide reductase OsmC/OhrA
MSTHTAKVTWSRGQDVFSDGKYNRVHTISFDGGASMVGSPAPSVVRPPLSNPEGVDPEEMLVASASACHMLFFLDFARKAGHVVDSYLDEAEGRMDTDDRGRIAIVEIVLKPQISFSGDNTPDAAGIALIHHKAHEACFIANSLRCDVRVEA